MIQRQLKDIVIVIVTAVLLISSSVTRSHSAEDLPPLQAHELPQFIVDWQNYSNEDYFEQIEPTPLGYLVWSKFPLKVYLEQPKVVENSATNKRFRDWALTVKSAIAEWNEYFPLQETNEKETADIVIVRSQPEREITLNPDTGLYDIPRAIAAQTNYTFYPTKNPTTIAVRMTVQVSDRFVGKSLLATVRHELGHALGIWGHSPNESDALYFSQVSQPPSISKRDLNTLKKIYQQPTRLGWKI